ncbi:MAG: restriction endonuclease [Candidatus Saccharimonadales bacterium]
MKRRRSRTVRDILLVFTLGLVLFLRWQHFSDAIITNLLMLCLLLGTVIYIVISEITEIAQLARQTIQLRRLRQVVRSQKPVDTMTWAEFEYYVASWLKNQGYSHVELTEHYDLGVDIIAKKDGITWGIQVKHYRRLVGIEAVRQVVVALKKYNCDRAMVVTNSFFSTPAKELAKSQGCLLIDRPRLLRT